MTGVVRGVIRDCSLGRSVGKAAYENFVGLLTLVPIHREPPLTDGRR